ncbi:MAG: nucleotidyl transferase AbiEii/AbiGii toxin family protein [Acidobacteriota bacterium]
MKDHALALARDAPDPGQARNRLREYIQTLVLRSLHESEAFRSLVFVGGTALRFLYGLPRFSEDLDFCQVTGTGADGQAWLAKTKRDLQLAGFAPEVTWNTSRTVHVGWVHIGGLLQEAGLAGRAAQKLAIKLEIDTRPPAGWRSERHVVTRHVTFLLHHHDRPSLFGGKLCAALTRPYAKGRDWYDVLWYLSQRPPVEPNLPLLQSALDQTRGAGRGHLDAQQWRTLVCEALVAVNMDAMRDDVLPFLERPQDAAYLTRETLLALL